MNELIFPPEVQLTVDHLTKVGQHLDIYARSQRIQAICPDCQSVSTKIQARYWRHPQDLPWLGMTVRLHLEVRRFACQMGICPRKTFTEPLRGWLGYKARRTTRLKEHHLATAYALGGEAGRELSRELGMPISGDTLIREIRQTPEPAVPTVRVVGVDDWALRKGNTYGTILVDLEKQQPIELLSSRETAEVSAWLQKHPEIEIISRDRGKDYIKAATEGAPQAEQVADRWHLLKNLREAVITFLQQKPMCLQATAPELAVEAAELKTEAEPVEVRPEIMLSVEPEPAAEVGLELCQATPGPELAKTRPPTQVEQAKATRHARRQEQYERVRQLNQEGLSGRAISQRLKISRQTVRQYLKAATCPQYAPGRVRQSKLTPWITYLEQRWQAGCTNASQLWREIAQQGFSGSLGLVGRWAVAQRKLLPAETRYRRQQAETIKPALARQLQPVPWSAQRASWLFILDESRLEAEEQTARRRMRAADPELVTVDDLARRFVLIVKERQVDKLDQWLADVATSGLNGFKSFANGIRADLNAVRNALKLRWSNGQVEGQINHLKFIKRQMYGRAKIDLLRKRVLYRDPAH